MELDIDKINDSLLEIIESGPTVANGTKILKKVISRDFSYYEIKNLDKIDMKKGYEPFKKWLDDLFENEPLPKKISGINFGLFDTDDGLQLYITGSYSWDKNDYDWATANDYFPDNRYPYLDILTKPITKVYDEEVNVGVIFAITVFAMFINTYVSENMDFFLQISEEMYFSTGFDDGDLYNICRLSEEGLEIIY